MKRSNTISKWAPLFIFIFVIHGYAVAAPLCSNVTNTIFETETNFVRLVISSFDEYNLVEWFIEGELEENVTIILDRAVNDKNFKPIASFYDVSTNYFQFKDYLKPNPGDYYYRISVQNIDIGMDLTKIALIELKDSTFYEPTKQDLNVFHHTLHINFLGADGQIDEIHFYTADGKRLFSKKTCHLERNSFTFPNITKPGEYLTIIESKQWGSRKIYFVKPF